MEKLSKLELEQENLKNSTEREDSINKFHENFPLGNIEFISKEEVPKEVLIYLEEKLKRYGFKKEEYEKGINKYYIIHHDNGDVTIGLHQNISDSENNHIFLERRGTVQIGEGSTKYVLDKKGYEEKPFVGWTRTKSGFLRQGLGLRRLQYMNSLCVMEYGRPLYSAYHPDPIAQKAWEKLDQMGLVKKVSTEANNRMYERFVFKDIKEN